MVAKTLLCGHRNESRKGCDHYSKDANPGNFLTLMNFRAEAGDEFATLALQVHFKKVEPRTFHKTALKTIIAPDMFHEPEANPELSASDSESE